MKNHQTKTSLLSYNTKNRYRNKIESEGGISLSFPFSNDFFFFFFFPANKGEQGNFTPLLSFLYKRGYHFVKMFP